MAWKPRASSMRDSASRCSTSDGLLDAGNPREGPKVTAPSGYILKPYEDRELHINIECALSRAMERKLEERERWLAATLMSMGDGVVAIDNDARIIFLNPMGERLTGWNNEEAKGRVLEEVVRLSHEISGQPVESPLRVPAAFREGKSTSHVGQPHRSGCQGLH